MPEGWVIRTALEFWNAAPPAAASYPRDPERAVPWSLPLAVSRIPELWVEAVERRLALLGVPWRLGCARRRLHGCLVAWGGSGLMFVDADDTPDEQRYTIAHEVGHFVADYLEPRRGVARRLSPQALDVLDGLRPPTETERLDAALVGRRLEPYRHLLPRDGASLQAESRADRLALELLAPEADALARLRAEPHTEPAVALRRAFGLPPMVARQYARWLTPSRRAVPGAWLLEG